MIKGKYETPMAHTYLMVKDTKLFPKMENKSGVTCRCFSYLTVSVTVTAQAIGLGRIAST